MAEAHPMKRILVTLALLAAFPAVSQNLTAVLRVHGNVMIDNGSGFVPATDGQPIIAGQRIMIGEGDTATVMYSSDCKRSFSDAGVYTVEPGNCKDKDHDRSNDQSVDDSVAGTTGGQTLQSLGIILGSAALAAEGIRQQGTNTAISR
jgi:hypothetical protein